MRTGQASAMGLYPSKAFQVRLHARELGSDRSFTTAAAVRPSQARTPDAVCTFLICCMSLAKPTGNSMRCVAPDPPGFFHAGHGSGVFHVDAVCQNTEMRLFCD